VEARDQAVATRGDRDQAVYDIEQLRFRHGDRFTLEIDALRVMNGERLGIAGPNGSGKTTLLRILAFLDPPETKGRFHFRGRPHSPAAGRARDTAFLRQQPYLFAGTAADNLDFPLRVRGIPRAERRSRVRAMLERLELPDRARIAARKLSGGEQKRVALGRVLISDPGLILLDEPTAHLDARSRTVVEQTLARTAATLVFTTHDVRLAHRLAHRVLYLRDGCVSAMIPENVLAGRAAGDRMETEGGLAIALGGPVAPGPIRVAIDPRHMVVALQPIASSMRNQFAGRVVTAHEHPEGVWLEVDCGERLTAIITRSSYDRLGLNLNTAVYISFKANSVEVV
jgi:molybdopterin-binding protein